MHSAEAGVPICARSPGGRGVARRRPGGSAGNHTAPCPGSSIGEIIAVPTREMVAAARRAAGGRLWVTSGDLNGDSAQTELEVVLRHWCGDGVGE